MPSLPATYQGTETRSARLSTSRPHPAQARPTAQASQAKPPLVASQAKVPMPAQAAAPAASHSTTSRSTSSARGGTTRSPARPSSRTSARRRPATARPGARCRIMPRWPCSQRVRWLAAAAAVSGKWLVTSACSQKTGAWPASARSMPSCMSSTRLPVANSARSISRQGKAMPVPVSAHGRPRRAAPRGRTQFFTRQANSATRPLSPGGVACCMRYRAWAGASACRQAATSASRAPGASSQSASTITSTMGGAERRWSTPKANA
jgi:hypothetical protein